MAARRAKAPTDDLAWWRERLKAWGASPGQRAGGGLRARCPVHEGDNERALKIDETSRGVEAYCHACGARTPAVRARLEGSPVKAAETPVPEAKKAARTRQKAARVSDPVGWYEDYLAIPRGTLDKMGLPVSASPEGHVRHLWPSDPHMWKDRECRGAKAQRYWPGGGATPLLWPDVPDELPERIILTEGETDAIVMRYRGYPDTWAITKGASDPPEEEHFRALEARGVRQVTIAFDADDKGRQGAEKAVEEALAAGLDVDWIMPGGYDPLTGRMKDWRDWHAGLAEGQPAELPDPARSEMGRLMSDMAKDGMEVEWLVPGLMYRGGVTLLSGLQKSGKSTFAAAMLGALGRGEPFMDEQQRVRPARTRRRTRGAGLVILTEEWGPPIGAKHAAHSLPDDTTYYTATEAIRSSASLAKVMAQAARRVEACLSEGRHAIVVIDTFLAWGVLGGLKDENDAAQVAEAVERMRAAFTGAAVLLVSHARKGGGERTESVRGSTALPAAVDIVVEFGETGQTGEDKRVRGLNVRGRVVEPFGLITRLADDGRSYEMLGKVDSDLFLNPHKASSGNARPGAKATPIPWPAGEFDWDKAVIEALEEATGLKRQRLSQRLKDECTDLGEGRWRAAREGD